MLTGKRFKILRSTVALDSESKRDWVQIPAGALVEVTAGPHGPGNRLVELLWEGRRVAMFATDLKASMEIESQGVTSKRATPGPGYGSTGAA